MSSKSSGIGYIIFLKEAIIKAFVVNENMKCFFFNFGNYELLVLKLMANFSWLSSR